MKTYLIILLVFMAGAIYVSCTKDTRSNPLLGTWMLTSEELIECRDTSDIYQADIPCSDSVCFRITFVQDGKMKVNVTMEGVTNSWSETYTIKGNKISICGPDGCKNQGTFMIRDTQLILADSLISENGCLKKEYYKKLDADQ